MAMSTESKGGTGIGSLLVFLSGIGVGLLIATKPGKETREQIVDWLNEGKSKSKDLLRRGREQVENAKDRMTSEGGKEPFYESGKYT